MMKMTGKSKDTVMTPIGVYCRNTRCTVGLLYGNSQRRIIESVNIKDP